MWNSDIAADIEGHCKCRCDVVGMPRQRIHKVEHGFAGLDGQERKARRPIAASACSSVGGMGDSPYLSTASPEESHRIGGGDNGRAGGAKNCRPGACGGGGGLERAVESKTHAGAD